jgi:small subunit ribosomal protein S4
MGDPKKQKKKYKTPRHPWVQSELEGELRLVGEYGLRNKRELWHYKSMLSRMRGIARSILSMSEEERAEAGKAYLNKLSRLSIIPENGTIDDTLDLDVKNLLERRFQTIAYRNGYAKSIHQARELIVHGHLAIGDKVVSVPSYLVQRSEEPNLKFNPDSPLSNPEHPSRKVTVQPHQEASREKVELSEESKPE